MAAININVPVFNGLEYEHWHYRLMTFLKLQECDEVITLEERPENVQQATWDGKALKAKNFIINAVSNKQLDLIKHQLNGVAERLNRSIMNKTRCLREEAGVEKQFWPECLQAACYLSNRCLANTVLEKTPYEIFYGEKPNVKNLKLYGSTAYVRTPAEKRTKLDPKAQKGILIGYTDSGYRILIGNKVVVSRNVRFLETDEKVIKVPLRDNKSATVS